MFDVLAAALVYLASTTETVIIKRSPLQHMSINCMCVRDCDNCQVAATLKYMLTLYPPPPPPATA
jgi:hypothetical protein